MKKINRIFLSLSLLCLTVTSCGDIDDLNKDEKAFEQPVADALMTSAQLNYVNQLITIDVNSNIFRYLSQHWTNIYAIGNKETRYNFTRDIGGALFRTMYIDVLQDLNNSKKFIEKTVVLTPEEIAIKQNKLAIIDVQIANTYLFLVDCFGDVPYTEALVENNYNPKYDDGQSIYLSIANKLTNAINNLDTNKSSFNNNQDIIYNGNVAKWKKFANSLCLKIGLHLYDVNKPKADELINAAVASGVINSNNDNAIVKYFNTANNQSPIYLALINNDQYVPTKLFVDELNSKSDPRADKYFDPTSKIGGNYLGAVYASSGSFDDYSHFSTTFNDPTLPGVIFDYAETCFLLADAANKGYSVGGSTEDWYNNGITASMQSWGMTSTEITTYLAQPSVAFSTATGINGESINAKEKIAYQLWLSYGNRGFEAWTEFRRLDYPRLQAPSNAELQAQNKVPVRLFYSRREQNLNTANYTSASNNIGGDLITTKLFWDKF